MSSFQKKPKKVNFLLMFMVLGLPALLFITGYYYVGPRMDSMITGNEGISALFKGVKKSSEKTMDDVQPSRQSENEPVETAEPPTPPSEDSSESPEVTIKEVSPNPAISGSSSNVPDNTESKPKRKKRKSSASAQNSPSTSNTNKPAPNNSDASSDASTNQGSENLQSPGEVE